MPDETATPTEPTPTPADQQVTESATDTPDLGDAGKKALDAEREARKAAEQRAKALDKELNAFRQSSMSEAEKAIAEAKTAGRAEAVSEFGKRLAWTEFDAAVGRRNPDFDSASVSEWLDLSGSWVRTGNPTARPSRPRWKRIVPAPAEGPPSFDGGARSTTPVSSGMNSLIRKAAGRA